MANKTQIVCYFKSADMAELCKGSTDIIIHFNATYPPDAYPVFEISANSMDKGGDTGKSIKAKAAPADEGGGGIPGCPKPCP